MVQYQKVFWLVDDVCYVYGSRVWLLLDFFFSNFFFELFNVFGIYKKICRIKDILSKLGFIYIVETEFFSLQKNWRIGDFIVII